jgi:hypothetical protein
MNNRPDTPQSRAADRFVADFFAGVTLTDEQFDDSQFPYDAADEMIADWSAPFDRYTLIYAIRRYLREREPKEIKAKTYSRREGDSGLVRSVLPSRLATLNRLLAGSLRWPDATIRASRRGDRWQIVVSRPGADDIELLRSSKSIHDALFYLDAMIATMRLFPPPYAGGVERNGTG